MIDWLAASVLAVGFIVLLKQLKVIEMSRNVIALSRRVMSVLVDKNLTELDKEKAMQRHSLDFFRYFFFILLGSITALAAPLGMVWLLQQVGITRMDRTLAITLSWQFLVGTCAVAAASFYFFNRRK